MTETLSILVCILLLLFIWSVRDLLRQGWEWNRGVCRKCNENWSKFHDSFTLGRGYVCRCGRHLWITNHLVDRIYETKEKEHE